MKIGRHGLREHIRLLAPLLGFIAAVWLLRLVLGAAGISHNLIHALSVTAAASLSVLLAALLIHLRNFGSYPNVVMASFLLILWGQLLIILAIVFSLVTGTENIFTAPEFSIPADDIYHLRHILGHLTFGVGAGSLIGAAAGCFLLWLLRLLAPLRSRG